MTLAAFLEASGITVPEFAATISSTVSTVTKWKRCERIPSDRWMRAIANATSGAVMPNDFVFDPDRVAMARAK